MENIPNTTIMYVYFVIALQLIIIIAGFLAHYVFKDIIRRIEKLEERNENCPVDEHTVRLIRAEEDIRDITRRGNR